MRNVQETDPFQEDTGQVNIYAGRNKKWFNKRIEISTYTEDSHKNTKLQYMLNGDINTSTNCLGGKVSLLLLNAYLQGSIHFLTIRIFNQKADKYEETRTKNTDKKRRKSVKYKILDRKCDMIAANIPLSAKRHS